MKSPSVVFVFADQLRAQAVGYAGDPNARTPHLDALAAESVNFVNAVAGCPVCSPYRASLMTGQYPLTHGVFVNDVYLQPRAASIAQAFAAAGYATAYIGKWHLDGHGRSNYIPPERRQGFDYWKVLECTHDYNHSAYYEGNSDRKQYWEDYDALAQTRAAQDYLRTAQDRHEPFLLMLSWGPPHDPYMTAPPEFLRLYRPEALHIRPNVPPAIEGRARTWLAGYYAHVSALDHCVGELQRTLKEIGLEERTIFVFTSDHGDMLGSQGQHHKQRPWDESVRIPFLLRAPGLLGSQSRRLDAPLDAPDLMPTLLGLCGLPITDSVQGLDYSGYIHGGADPSDGAALLMCPQPFGQWTVTRDGGKEYRGLRTSRYTYVRDLQRPWLLYDNEADPWQMANLVGRPQAEALCAQLDAWLQRRLRRIGDEFRPGMDYIRQWGYPVDATGTVPYTD
jgi:arylsulfatase A-like enzyme